MKGKNQYNPLVSVIIPTYMREKYMFHTLNSIVTQTYTNIEIIVVSDCSPDNTELVVKSFNDNRIKYISLEKNSGLPAVTRNIGIKQSKGKYIAFCDDDDIWSANKLEKQIKYFDAYDLVCTNRQYIDANNSLVVGRRLFIPPKFNLLFFLLSSFITTSSVVIKRSFLDKIGGFGEYEKSRGLEDHELWCRFLITGGRIKFIDENLVNYRIHNNNISKNRIYRLMSILNINNSFFKIYKVNFFVRIMSIIINYGKIFYLKLNSFFNRT